LLLSCRSKVLSSPCRVEDSFRIGVLFQEDLQERTASLATWLHSNSPLEHSGNSGHTSVAETYSPGRRVLRQNQLLLQKLASFKRLSPPGRPDAICRQPKTSYSAEINRSPFATAPERHAQLPWRWASAATGSRENSPALACEAVCRRRQHRSILVTCSCAQWRGSSDRQGAQLQLSRIEHCWRLRQTIGKLFKKRESSQWGGAGVGSWIWHRWKGDVKISDSLGKW
jgi:hypothetical protein